MSQPHEDHLTAKQVELLDSTLGISRTTYVALGPGDQVTRVVSASPSGIVEFYYLDAKPGDSDYPLFRTTFVPWQAVRAIEVTPRGDTVSLRSFTGPQNDVAIHLDGQDGVTGFGALARLAHVQSLALHGRH